MNNTTNTNLAIHGEKSNLKNKKESEIDEFTEDYSKNH